MNQLVEQTKVFARLPTDVLFKHAFEYYEVRMSKTRYVNAVWNYKKHGVVPQAVEDYCIEVMRLVKKILQ